VPLYTVRIGERDCFARAVTYDDMLRRIVERTLHAALARSIDAGDWEDEQLRRQGLESLQIYEGTRAIWSDRALYEHELAASRTLNADDSFVKENMVDPDLYDRLDRDLRRLWRTAGYTVTSLRNSMKPLFHEIEKDTNRYAEHARESVATDVMRLLFPDHG